MCPPPWAPRLVPPELGSDSWGSDGKVDGVLDGPWVLKDEDVLFGLLA